MEQESFQNSLERMSLGLREQHHVGGLPAGTENQLLISQFYTAWFYLASDLTSQQDLSEVAQLDRLSNFCWALCHGDLIDILNVCTDIDELLIGNSISTYDAFKQHCMNQYPSNDKLISRLLSPINPMLVSLFECPDVKAESLKLIRPFLRYGKKLNLLAIGLEEQAITAYLECEDSLSALCLEQTVELCNGLNSIMKCWLRDLDLSKLVPKHGSGSVSEGKLTLYEKYKNLSIDLYLKVVLGPFWQEYYPCGTKGEIVRVSRTIFVPKTYAKLRTISMEPLSLMYFQQGVMSKLYDYIEHHPYMGMRIKLRDQSQNQRMAEQASIDNSMSTLDLSAASDSVSWALVKRIFAGTPLLKWLYATRSKKTVLPNGNIILLKKFAPMGSALCFPVECLIFACVIEYVSQKWCYANNSSKKDYSVFGDDLIVASEITTDVIAALTALGFHINLTKSFTDGPFRESCGKDYYAGVDVSAVYYRINYFNSKSMSPQVYSALCSAINQCAERGLTNLRRYLISLLLTKKPYFTNTTSESPHLWSSQPTNYHVRRRYHEDWQLWLGKFCTVLSRPVPVERNADDDDIAYFIKLAQMAERSNDISPLDEPQVGITLHGVRILLGYVEHEVDGKVTP